jgi:hypothetical protein
VAVVSGQTVGMLLREQETSVAVLVEHRSSSRALSLVSTGESTQVIGAENRYSHENSSTIGDA